jgi:ABC-type dipeptide/oligopeptide/nickel transport system ATPase component
VGAEAQSATAAARRSALGGAAAAAPILSVERLTTGFDIAGRFVPAVIDVSFHLGQGETLCLVGESGSGKSVTALSIMRLLSPPAASPAA